MSVIFTIVKKMDEPNRPSDKKSCYFQCWTRPSVIGILLPWWAKRSKQLTSICETWPRSKNTRMSFLTKRVIPMWLCAYFLRVSVKSLPLAVAKSSVPPKIQLHGQPPAFHTTFSTTWPLSPLSVCISLSMRTHLPVPHFLSSSVLPHCPTIFHIVCQVPMAHQQKQWERESGTIHGPRMVFIFLTTELSLSSCEFPVVWWKRREGRTNRAGEKRRQRLNTTSQGRLRNCSVSLQKPTRLILSTLSYFSHTNMSKVIVALKVSTLGPSPFFHSWKSSTNLASNAPIVPELLLSS